MLEDAGAWHTAELAFCFDNTKRCEQGTGNTPEAQALAKKMATAWANFARTGNPSQPGLTWTHKMEILNASFNMAEVMHSSLTSLKTLAEQKKISFTWSIDKTVPEKLYGIQQNSSR